jgi:hypothetical protein
MQPCVQEPMITAIDRKTTPKKHLIWTSSLPKQSKISYGIQQTLLWNSRLKFENLYGRNKK